MQPPLVNGVSVTAPCWAWQRNYTCRGISQASDCAELRGRAGCRQTNEICLDDPQEGACQVRELVFQCPIGSNTSPGTQYICGNDVYCLNGDCEPIEREASTEFRDALVGLHALGQANSEFDENALTLFSGERLSCSKKLFGLANCCTGRGVPILTPWLCDSEERDLDERDDRGLCHKVGTYCSSKVLGVCVTKRDAYCCYESKLSRIIQEQGRPQLGLTWASAKTEQCRGFTIEQFQRLDLSRMDFTEVYAEFEQAVRLPSEIDTAQRIQDRIRQYYQTNGGRP